MASTKAILTINLVFGHTWPDKTEKFKMICLFLTLILPYLRNLSFRLTLVVSAWIYYSHSHKPFNTRGKRNASGCLFLGWKISVPFNFLFSECKLNDFMIWILFTMLTMNSVGAAIRHPFPLAAILLLELSCFRLL